MFDVDVKGLRQLVHRRGTEYLVLELLSNSLDEPGVTQVSVDLCKIEGQRARVAVTVTDDAPDGFVNLKDAWTLFGDTRKRGNAEVRGRFNLGEKLIIAACDTATITTTTGCVHFEGGDRSRPRRKTERGSVFEGVLRMTQEELDRCLRLLRQVIISAHKPNPIAVFINGTTLGIQLPIATTKAQLQTEVADTEGVLRRTIRNTTVELYPALEGEDGEEPYLYEMGIPVCPWVGNWHVNVQQKVPLNMDRDGVPLSYRRKLRALTVNMLAEQRLIDERSCSGWMKSALEEPEVTMAAVSAVIRAEYGDKVVVRDPSDPEAVNQCVAHGYRVIEAGSFSRAAWANIRNAGVALPAGKVMPTRGPNVAETDYLREEQLTTGMRFYRTLCQRVVGLLLDVNVRVVFIFAPEATTIADWTASGMTSPSQLRVNVGHPKIGAAWFEHGCCEECLDLLIHEMSHEWASNHLSAQYHDACTRLGARLALAAAADPSLLRWGE